MASRCWWPPTTCATRIARSDGTTILAAGGAASAGLATGAALVSTAFFTLIWGGFIIGGNYFAYWYCHQWAQSNHFIFMYWGFFVLIVPMI